MKFKKVFIFAAFAASIMIAFGFQNSSEHKVLFEKAKFTMETKGDLKGAIKLFEEIIKKYPDERECAAKSQLYIGLCYEKLGLEQAQKAFQKVIDNYPEQAEVVKVANEKLSLLLKAQAMLEKGEKEFKMRKVWADAIDYFFVGTPSPDGRYVSYVNWETGDLGVHDLVTGENRLLTKEGSLETGEMAESCIFSPDGQKVACTWLNKDGLLELRIIGLDGTAPRVLYINKETGFPWPASWSDDGKQVIFKSDRTGSTGIWIINIADGRPKGPPQLVRAEMGNIFPLGITRDGSFYYGLYSGWSDVYVATIDPKTGKVLTPPVKAVRHAEGFNSTPDWSPDGQYLACRSSRGGPGSAGLLIHSFLSDKIHELEPKGVRGLNFHFLRWSPDGRSILVVGTNEKGKYGYLFSINAQTGESEIIADPDPEGAIFQPDWAIDGESVFFLRRTRETRCIVRRDLSNGTEKELARVPSGAVYWLSLSPDGRQLVFSSENKLMLLPADGGKPQELIQVKGFIRTIAWTRDGQYVIYGIYGGKPDNKEIVELWRIPAKGGEPQKLELEMSNLMHLRFHPDGRRIAFTAMTQPEKAEVWVMENFLPNLKDKK